MEGFTRAEVNLGAQSGREAKEKPNKVETGVPLSGFVSKRFREDSEFLEIYGESRRMVKETDERSRALRIAMTLCAPTNAEAEGRNYQLWKDFEHELNMQGSTPSDALLRPNPSLTPEQKETIETSFNEYINQQDVGESKTSLRKLVKLLVQ